MCSKDGARVVSIYSGVCDYDSLLWITVCSAPVTNNNHESGPVIKHVSLLCVEVGACR
jgi:hypothetical protein